MARDRVVARVVRVSTVGPEGDPPATPTGIRELTAAPLLDNTATMLAGESVDVVGYASTTSAYVIGFDEEAAMVSRPSTLLDVPVAATCASAVLALRDLGVERVALVGAPWFDPELTSSAPPTSAVKGSTSCRRRRPNSRATRAESNPLPSTPGLRGTSERRQKECSSAGTGSARHGRSSSWRPGSSAQFSRRIRFCSGTSSHRPAPQSRSLAWRLLAQRPERNSIRNSSHRRDLDVLNPCDVVAPPE
jgi:hypothetical protein